MRVDFRRLKKDNPQGVAYRYKPVFERLKTRSNIPFGDMRKTFGKIVFYI